jgi:hypothetical protein
MTTSPLKTLLSEWVRTQPALYAPFARRREEAFRLRRVVRPGDDFVIDGYPRSANTFSTHAFLLAQAAPIKVGNHTHAAAQFHLAKAYGVPALLVIREPVGAVASAMVYAAHTDPRPQLLRYIVFHRSVLRARSAFEVGRFEELTTNFGAVIERVNNRFETNFGASYGADEAVFASIRAHHDRVADATGVVAPERSTLPSEGRRQAGVSARERLHEARVGGLLRQAQHLYAEITGA